MERYAGGWKMSPFYWPKFNFHAASLKPTTSLVSNEFESVRSGQRGISTYWRPSHSGSLVSVFGVAPLHSNHNAAG